MNVRAGVFYVCLAALILAGSGMIAIGSVYISDLRASQTELELAQTELRAIQSSTRERLLIGCGRANDRSEVIRWLLEHSEMPPPPAIRAKLELDPEEYPDAERPWLVDCARAYP